MCQSSNGAYDTRLLGAYRRHGITTLYQVDGHGVVVPVLFLQVLDTTVDCYTRWVAAWVNLPQDVGEVMMTSMGSFVQNHEKAYCTVQSALLINRG